MSEERYQKGCLRSIHHLKASYQRNMIIANVVVTAAVALLLLLLSGSGPQGDPAVPVLFHSSRSGAIPRAMAAYSAGIGNRDPGAGRLDGFGTKYRIIPDRGAPTPSVTFAATRVELDAPVIYEEPCLGAGANNLVLGSQISDSDDFGLPTSAPYMPEISRGPQSGSGRSQMSRREEDKPARMWLVPPRLPLTAKSFDTGLVQISLVIDTDGCITWDVITEIPSGEGFASVVIDALIHSRYEPAVRDGRKTEQGVTLNLILCRECSPGLSYEGNIWAAWKR